MHSRGSRPCHLDLPHPSQVPIINLPTDLPATWLQPSNRFQNTLLPSRASDHFGKASVRLEKQRVKASQQRKRPTKHENGGERESIICRRQRVHQTQKGCFVWLTSESGYPIAKMRLLSLPPPPTPSSSPFSVANDLQRPCAMFAQKNFVKPVGWGNSTQAFLSHLGVASVERISKASHTHTKTTHTQKGDLCMANNALTASSEILLYLLANISKDSTRRRRGIRNKL